MSWFGITYLPESITTEVASHPEVRSRRYAVIGAGSAGLCAIKYLKQAGAENIICYEIGTKIGGLWCYGNDAGTSSAYKSLHINTARAITRFSHMPLPADIQDFPDHADMYAYFTAYAARFDLLRHIRFNSRVVNVRRAPEYTDDKPRWLVQTESGNVADYDCVIVASGHLWEPWHVDAFRNAFAGQYMHAASYRRPEDFVGKRICVIGAANTAFDVSSDVCSTAARTVVVARSGVIVHPKSAFGYPFREILLQLDRRWMPDRLKHCITNLLTYMMHGDMTKLGFKRQTRRQLATSNGTLVAHIKERRIEIKHGIEKIEGKRIFFADNTSEEFDTLIAATGYRLGLSFIPQDAVSTDGLTLDLYKRIVQPGQHGLWFLGFANPTITSVLLFEHQMKWILAFESGQAELPTAAEMWADIAAKKKALQARYGDSNRYSLVEPHAVYFPQLEQSRLDGASRKRGRHQQRAAPSHDRSAIKGSPLSA